MKTKKTFHNVFQRIAKNNSYESLLESALAETSTANSKNIIINNFKRQDIVFLLKKKHVDDVLESPFDPKYLIIKDEEENLEKIMITTGEVIKQLNGKVIFKRSNNSLVTFVDEIVRGKTEAYKMVYIQISELDDLPKYYDDILQQIIKTLSNAAELIIRKN
jgi:hypothetical protein